MRSVLEFVLNNFELIATVILMVIGAVLGGRRLAWFQWANEVLFLAFDQAEKRGLLEGIKGSDKLAYYLAIWREAYMKRYGEEPNSKAMQYAVNKAAELAQKEKTIKQTIVSLSDPKS